MTNIRIVTPEDFGRAVYLARKRLGYTQVELAGLCGTGERFIVELENGKPTAALGKALHVAQMLGLEIQVVGAGK